MAVDTHPRTPKVHPRTPKVHARTPKAHARTPKAHARTPKAHARTPKAHAVAQSPRRDRRPTHRMDLGERATRRLAALGVAFICALVCYHVVLRSGELGISPLTVFYTVIVSLYVVSRFAFAAFYQPPEDTGLEPHVAVIVPAFNEGEAVARTIHSVLALDYPADKLEVVVINDGSSDDTWERILTAADEHPPGAVRCIDLGSNQGKRAAMATGMRATTAEIVLFVDSDSMPARMGLRKLVQGFSDPRVGCVAGMTHVRNASTNTLTRMQAARYYISFQLLKKAESVLGTVSCCPGCFSAYRREAILPLINDWEHQRFLGVECTYGDDRALTNRVLKTGWRSLYDSRAEAWTDAPDDYHKFFKQQLRWKKSWSREGPILLSHIWRSHPLALPAVLLATIAGLLSPFVLGWNLIVAPLTTGNFPIVYLLALYLIALAYGLLYRSQRNDGHWLYAIVGTFFYILFSFQLLWAVARIRDGSWGTREA